MYSKAEKGEGMMVSMMAAIERSGARRGAHQRNGAHIMRPHALSLVRGELWRQRAARIARRGRPLTQTALERRDRLVPPRQTES